MYYVFVWQYIKIYIKIYIQVAPTCFGSTTILRENLIDLSILLILAKLIIKPFVLMIMTVAKINKMSSEDGC